MDKLRVLLVGIGGYASVYVRELTMRGGAGGIEAAGVVDPFAEKSPVYEDAKRLTSVFCHSLEEFYASHAADLAVVGTPIPLHAPQAVYCMEHGSHVLLEKPVAGALEDAGRIIEAKNRTGRQVAIGFQWCSDPAMNLFRRDVQAGVFGEILSMRALVLWPRDIAYYQRTSGWAGRKYDKAGHPIFDSVLSNATAHYLENMLWVANRELTDIEVATARANPIETFDTIVLRGKLGKADLTYAATHAGGRAIVQDPMFEYIFEKGKITFGGYRNPDDDLIFRFSDGTVRSYGESHISNGLKPMHKLWNFVDVIRNGGRPDCTLEEGMLHTRVISAVHALQPDSYVFPQDQVRLDRGMYWVPGLCDRLIRCYEERELPKF